MSYYLTLDARAVHQAALSLEIPEFEIFRLAHAAWYCESACERRLERYFVYYLFEGKVPVWVRAFTRHAIRDVAADRSRTCSERAPEWRTWLSILAGIPEAVAADHSASGVLLA